MNRCRLLGKLSVVFLLALALQGTSAQAAEGGNTRTHHRFGVYLGIIEPFPSLVSGNIGINVFDFLRVHAGYGTVTGSGLSIKTLGGGVNFFLPTWSFSPTVGLAFANVDVSGTLSTGTGVQGFSGSGSHLYVPIGFDWQAGIGFNLGFGYNYSLKSGVGGLPYVTLGWYF